MPWQNHKVKETDIQRACMEYLQAQGIFCWRSNQIPVPLKGGGFRRFAGMKGVSDILGCLPGGRFLACEIKKPGKYMTPEQREFQETIAGLGGVALCVRSVEELAEDMKSLQIIR